jgi:hypothetical protein
MGYEVGPMRKALVVGIDEYPDSLLSGCVNDAVAFNELISINGDGSPNFETNLKLNIKTKSDLISGIETLFSGVAEVALLYYAGHGIDDINGYLVTPDYKTSRYGVSMDEILTIVNSSAISNKIIILDSCFSGLMGFPSGIKTTEAKLASGVTIMSASESNQASGEVNGHGVFTARAAGRSC